MNRLRWKIIKHSEISKDNKLLIAGIKNEHWPYGLDSQLKWMNEHIRGDDLHFMGTDKYGLLQAYLTVVRIFVSIGNDKKQAFGVGGVCVDKNVEHSGYGRELMSVVNEYLQEERIEGFLLCKDKLIDFYKKCNWKKIYFKEAFIEGKPYLYNIMTFPYFNEVNTNTIFIDRNF